MEYEPTSVGLFRLVSTHFDLKAALNEIEKSKGRSLWNQLYYRDWERRTIEKIRSGIKKVNIK